MPDTINELLQELVGYGVPEPVVYAYAAELIKYGADSAVYRRERGYLMKCCDCGLVHQLEFKTFAETKQKRNGTFTMVELPWPIRVLFRARRQR